MAKLFKWWARIGFIAFLLYYFDEAVTLARTGKGLIYTVIVITGLALWFAIPLVPLAYYGFRKEK